MKRELHIVDDKLVDQTTMRLDDLRAVADHCKRLQSAGMTGTKDVRHLATVPRGLIEKWINDRGITFAEFMHDPKLATQMLNDPALAYFRVAPGRV